MCLGEREKQAGGFGERRGGWLGFRVTGQKRIATINKRGEAPGLTPTPERSSGSGKLHACCCGQLDQTNG